MKVFIVMVKAGAGSLPERYVDSLWISKESANERVEFLKQRFREAGTIPSGNSLIWLCEAKLEDAKLVAPRKKK